ncbi:hypothetical protein AVEN_29641-1 [Araneus ventricosus]|uniref:Uncharacterized protein n=1 Tax=Araneus ventricosus TaxID=182803 RepID=A0A4Y2T9N2_ARAVE|nr:hypothetical protein AVEN_29641-1 [Araneus ventricosus]
MNTLFPSPSQCFATASIVHPLPCRLALQSALTLLLTLCTTWHESSYPMNTIFPSPSQCFATASIVHPLPCRLALRSALTLVLTLCTTWHVSSNPLYSIFPSPSLLHRQQELLHIMFFLPSSEVASSSFWCLCA